MHRTTRLAAAAMAVLLVFSVVGPTAVAAADTNNTTNETATPTPTATATATPTTTETADANETENETADANETEVENETENGSANASDDAFGQLVSDFVHGMLGNQTNSTQPLGWFVSEYVTANNPGADKRPDHAGPPNVTERVPPWERGGTAGGPSADAGPKNASERGSGPPAWAGPDSDDTDAANQTENETVAPAGNGGGGERGPPEHAGSNGKGN